MLTSLIELTSTGEFEDNGSFFVEKATWVNADLVVELCINLPDSTNETRLIRCRMPRSHRILAAEYADAVSLTDEHVLIWPHSDPRAQLYFNGCAADTHALVGALLLSHHELVGEWFPFSQFMNSTLFSASVDLLEIGYGLLAEGPQSIINAYRTVLDDFGIHHSTPPVHAPVWWDGSRWQPETEHLYLLLIGNSYVVAPEFSKTSA